ncbi:MAG: hypothetical protein ABI947_25530 [Chloroflexota bacterium]
MNIWIIGATLFSLGQFAFYIICTPESMPRPIVPSRFDKIMASGLYSLAYLLSLLRLPFAIPPYGLKLFGVFVLKKHYQVSHYVAIFEMFRVLGDIINWAIGIVIVEHIVIIAPALKLVLYPSIFAEALRLFSEKGQMIFSVCWQCLPHRHIADYLQRELDHTKPDCALSNYLLRYCHYYILDDEQRIQFILSTLRCYAAADPELLTKLAYLSTLRTVPSSCGIRGGYVRDVARGEVFIHQSWTSDPWLLIGQALRRSPWLFDPRFLRRPFYYRTEANRLATLFVFTHARYSPTYALYQFGHEIKAARYDFFYRVLRWFKIDIEPKIQADGTFPFDQGISWLKTMLFGAQPARQLPLWQDQDVIMDVRKRILDGEKLVVLDIAVQYTYPLKYVEEVLMDLINNP